MNRAAWAKLGLGILLVFGIFWFVSSQQKFQSEVDLVDVTETAMVKKMIVSSPAFQHEHRIPQKYTCDGDNLSPPLLIGSVSEKAVTLALIVSDPDAPGTIWDHWIVFNMPPNIASIHEGKIPEGQAGKNSWGLTKYGGPCPPSGEHRYLFNVYALDTSITLPEGATKNELLEKMRGHIIESTTLTGVYSH